MALARARQFFAALVARIEPEEVSDLGQYLGPAERALFFQMEARDQHHCLEVFQRLRKAGHTDMELLVAALLHDVGKAGAHLGIWHRVAIVLMGDKLLAAISSGAEKADLSARYRLNCDGYRGWRYPFFVQRHHAALGACRAREAGCSPRTTHIIQHHHDDSKDEAIRALQGADHG